MTRSTVAFGCRCPAAAAVLILTVVLGTPTPLPGRTFPAPDVLRDISGERAYRHVVALSEKIGPHPAGTHEDRTSGEYIAAQLTRDGYAVEWQAFPLPFFAVHAVALAVPSHSDLTLHPHAMIYSPSTPPNGITAELVDVGIGRPEDIRRTTLAEKIALIERGTIPFRDKTLNVAAAGAVAAIIYNSRAEEFVGTVGENMRIPVVSLSGVEGLQLLDLARSGRVTARLQVETVIETRTTWNIVATKLGARDPHRVIVVGAHRDTVDAAPGANDNSSGVAVALEIAEALRRAPLVATIRFVFFGAEELGFYGSDYYVQHMGPARVVGMVNLDMEGVGERLQLVRDRGPDSLVLLAQRNAAQLGIKVQLARSSGSDHVNFERVGIPVVFLFRPDDPYNHTPKDTVDRVDAKLLEASTLLATAIVVNVSRAAP
jgi:aminopeptidase YwaD